MTSNASFDFKPQNARGERAQRKQKLIEAKQYALDSTLWTGDNVIVSNAIQYGVQNLQMNAKRVVYLGLSKIETKRAGEAELTRHGWGVKLYAKDFAQIFNIHESNVYEMMALGVDQLLKKIVDFEYIDSTTNKMVYRAFPWVAGAEYIKDEGKITLVFNDNLSPYITRMAASLGGYTIQKIKQSGGIRTVRGWRLFDLLTTQRDTGILKIGVEKLIKSLEVTEKMAEDYHDFKRKVLLPAIADIESNAKLSITFDETKRGRKISTLTFRFKDTEQKKRKAATDAVVDASSKDDTQTNADYQDDQSIWHADNLHKNPLVGRDANQPTSGALPPTKPFLGIVPTGFLDDEEIPFGDDTPPPVVSHQRP